MKRQPTHHSIEDDLTAPDWPDAIDWDHALWLILTFTVPDPRLSNKGVNA